MSSRQAFACLWGPGHFYVRAHVKPFLKSTLLVTFTAAATFVSTAAYYNHRVSRQLYSGFITQAEQMEAFNAIGRLEAYDRVENFLVAVVRKRRSDLFKCSSAFC